MSRGEHGGIFFRLLLLLLFCGFLAALYVARQPLMRLAGEFWVVDEPAAQSDALIVLGDDNYAADRAFHAAGLYREGVAPVVVASGRMLRQNVSMADVMEHDLESFGVSAGSIVKLTHTAQNTREEAVQAARLIQTRGWKRVIVVTSNYHARRARFIFDRILPASVSLRVSGARDSEFDPSRWWLTYQGQKLFMSELAGYLVARWELRTKPAPQGATSFLVLRVRG
ncbi:MAG TPA: YdcF family protein [Candidatus Acidoferrales bacterium]|nr:YdcF family protein [Candidatus Acidoferrales bacterium]